MRSERWTTTSIFRRVSVRVRVPPLMYSNFSIFSKIIIIHHNHRQIKIKAIITNEMQLFSIYVRVSFERKLIAMVWRCSWLFLHEHEGYSVDIYSISRETSCRDEDVNEQFFNGLRWVQMTLRSSISYDISQDSFI